MEESVPKAREINIWRTRPVKLLNAKASMIVPAARAIWRFADGVVSVSIIQSAQIISFETSSGFVIGLLISCYNSNLEGE